MHVDPRDIVVNLKEVCCKGDWQQNPTVIDLTSFPYARFPNCSCVFRDVPEGSHSITVNASETGVYWFDFFEASTFRANGSTTVQFTVDTTPPNITFLTAENQGLQTADANLNFTLDDREATVFFSLDQRANVTVAGNTTLSGLTAGCHTLTLYATDTAGNNASRTTSFNVKPPTPEPTPSQPPPTAAPEPTAQATNLKPQIVYVMAGLVAFLTLATALVLQRRNKKQTQARGNREQNQQDSTDLH
jgi:hypothetical protein